MKEIGGLVFPRIVFGPAQQIGITPTAREHHATEERPFPETARHFTACDHQSRGLVILKEKAAIASGEGTVLDHRRTESGIARLHRRSVVDDAEGMPVGMEPDEIDPLRREESRLRRLGDQLAFVDEGRCRVLRGRLILHLPIGVQSRKTPGRSEKETGDHEREQRE